MAAALAGGPGAVLSHRAAGDEHALATWSGTNDVTAPTRRRGNRVIHFHTASLPDDEVTTIDGLPITTLCRTLLDLATILSPARLLNAIEEADKRGPQPPPSVPDLLERHRGERGTGILRSVLADAGYGVAESELEGVFAEFVTARRLPQPELNAWLMVSNCRYRVDCLWRSERLIVELHSARHHGSTPAITRDATRDRDLLLGGWRVVHVTWAQLNDPLEAGRLERDLRRLLAGSTV